MGYFDTMPALSLDDPKTQGILALAAGLLKAGGPSPYPVSLGGALGQGAMAGLQQMGAAQQHIAQQQMMVQHAKLYEMQAKQLQMQQDAMQQSPQVPTNPEGLSVQQLRQQSQQIRGNAMRMVGLHPQAQASLMHEADRIDAIADKKEQYSGLQSQPGTPPAEGEILGTPRVGGMYSPYFDSPIVGQDARARQALLDSQRTGNVEAENRAYQALVSKHELGMQDLRREQQRREREAQARVEAQQNRLDTIAAGAANRPEPAPSLVYERDPQSNTGYTARDLRNDRRYPHVIPPGAVTAELRHTANQDQFTYKQFDAATKPQRDMLGQAETFRAIRATPDTGQAAVLAGDLLQRAARGGNTRLKGELDAILGSGYRGADIGTRMANFVSQELTGSPTSSTMSKLDRLMDAVEQGAMVQMSNQARFFVGQTKRHVLSTPFVQGRYVLAPNGELRQFPSEEAAKAGAQDWMEKNAK